MLVKINEVKKYTNDSIPLWINTDHIVGIDAEHGEILMNDGRVANTTKEDCIRVINAMQNHKPSIVDYAKVIDGLEHCSAPGASCQCTFCPYRNEDDEESVRSCSEVLMRDALKLIRGTGTEKGTQDE